MFTYRIVIDAYNARPRGRSVRVSMFVTGIDRADAFRKIRTIGIDQDGRVFPDLTRASGWIGTNNMPAGRFEPRSFGEWQIATVRSVPAAGQSRVLWEYEPVTQ